MPVIASSSTRLEIQRPKAKLVRPFIALFVIWLGILPLLLWRPAPQAFLTAVLLLVCLQAVALFTLSDVRFVASAQGLEMYGLFWRQWHVDLDHLTIREDKVGENIRFDAYVVQDGHRHRGAIVKKDFDKDSLERLLAFLVLHGAKVTRRTG